MTRAAQTVCLGGSRKKRSEKKGDFHCLTFFTAPTLTLGDLFYLSIQIFIARNENSLRQEFFLSEAKNLDGYFNLSKFLCK